MELKFVLVDDKHIDIYAIENKNNVEVKRKKKVGQIFTPSGSGEYIKNAIQVCGFSEAFDLWGCAVFGQLMDKPSVVARLEGRKPEHIQVKDIQLKFDWKTEPHKTQHSDFNKENCFGCYNKPCTCDNKFGNFTSDEINEGKGKKDKNPYDIKRAEDLNDLEKVKK